MIVVPNAGERYLLDRALKGTNNGNNYTLKLYNAVAGGLGEATVTGDFTESSFPGYAAKTLTPAGWNAAADAAGISSSTYSALQTFTCTGGGALQGVLGYFILDATTSVCIWAEAFAATANMINNGDKIEMMPYLEGA